MVKHIVVWKIKDEYDDNQKQHIAQNIKESLESLVGQIEGLESLTVHYDGYPSSTVDIYLESTFKDMDALNYYANEPRHVKVKEEAIIPFVSSREAFDYEL